MQKKEIINIVKNALREDAADRDITTQALIPLDLRAAARIITKENGVVCGLSIAELAFKLLDKNIKFKAKVKDGAVIKNGSCLAEIYGRARPILSAERTALNFLGNLCGIAAFTRQFVEKVKPYKTKILDTRKTTPNLRILEKYAVRCGGGFNYRFDLSEQILVKDNHIRITNDKLQMANLKYVVEAVRKNVKGKKIEIEVDNLRQFKEVIAVAPDIIMLDNFNLSDIKKAVKIKNRSPVIPLRAQASHRSPVKLEASGGITLRNIKKVAATGVDFISIGALTHSVKSLDLSLEITKKSA
ncbi:MAG: carboxylating nicotinate-nucleotide diphosphorylase [Candidatus Omnitrophota bacterium]|nr:carboxylating nicotinate-nucleotide diphosphorylase [Candidatus Omnitrophota bacterium]